jgi:tetratricopeptide (TPR) repeat protein
MNFDPNNKVIRLCADGMSLEGQGNLVEAKQLFLKAWTESVTDFEKFTSAHYVARHQDLVVEKLKWDETALTFALKIEEPAMKAYYPSLYLNIGKCYEDLNNFTEAREHYQKALSYFEYLPEDGYGKMIKSGIREGMQRVQEV